MGRRSPESGHACQIRLEQELAEGWDGCYGPRLSLEGRIELLAPYQGRAARWPGNGKSVAAPAGCREPHGRDFCEGGVFEFSTQRRAQLIGPACHRLTVR